MTEYRWVVQRRQKSSHVTCHITTGCIYILWLWFIQCIIAYLWGVIHLCIIKVWLWFGCVHLNGNVNNQENYTVKDLLLLVQIKTKLMLHFRHNIACYHSCFLSSNEDSSKQSYSRAAETTVVLYFRNNNLEEWFNDSRLYCLHKGTTTKMKSSH